MPLAKITWGLGRGAAFRAAPPCLLATVLFVVLTGQASPAHADAFDDHINRGNLFYNEQKLPQAVQEFEAAYRLKKQPDLLLNIGRIYLKLRRGEAAQRYCALYLTEEFEASPDRKAKAIDCVTQARQLAATKKAPAVNRLPTTPTPATTTPPAQRLPGKAPAPPAATGISTGPTAPSAPMEPTRLPTQPTASAPAPLVASLAVSPSPAQSASSPAREPTQPSPSPQPTLMPSRVEPGLGSASLPQPVPAPTNTRSAEHIPVYKRWWFWTIIGVGAAGAAAGITAGVLSSRGPAYELGDVLPENQRTVTLAQ